jgi:hypothetical protein
LASIFDTLLSSQESDTHHHPNQPARATGQPFKFTHLKLGSQTRDPLSERPALTRLESAGLRVGSASFETTTSLDLNPGTGLPRSTLTRFAVVSVAPCRADEQNSSRLAPTHANPPPAGERGGAGVVVPQGPRRTCRELRPASLRPGSCARA